MSQHASPSSLTPLGCSRPRPARGCSPTSPIPLAGRARPTRNTRPPSWSGRSPTGRPPAFGSAPVRHTSRRSRRSRASGVDHQPTLRKDALAHLETSTYIGKADIVVLLGPPGVGKTHLAIALVPGRARREPPRGRAAQAAPLQAPHHRRSRLHPVRLRRGKPLLPARRSPLRAGLYVELVHVDVRARLGQLAGSVEEARAEASEEVRSFVEVVRGRGLLPAGAQGSDGVSPEELVVALHGFVAESPSLLLAVSVSDLVGDRRPVNVPGTSREYPNWCVPLSDGAHRPVSLETLRASGLARRVWAAAVGRAAGR